MERLAGVTELLDGPLDDRAALVGNLRDLRTVNRHLGGITISVQAIEAVLEAVVTSPAHGATDSAAADGVYHRGGAPGPVRILDVGTGGADLPLGLLEHARRRGLAWNVTGIDSRPEVLAAAAVADPRITGAVGLELHVGDGRSLPYADRAFDIVHTSLVVHHLEPDEARLLMTEMVRVARLGIVVNDL